MRSELCIMKLIDKVDTIQKKESKRLIDKKIEQGYIVECSEEKYDYFTNYQIKWYEKIK